MRSFPDTDIDPHGILSAKLGFINNWRTLVHVLGTAMRSQSNYKVLYLYSKATHQHEIFKLSYSPPSWEKILKRSFVVPSALRFKTLITSIFL